MRKVLFLSFCLSVFWLPLFPQETQDLLAQLRLYLLTGAEQREQDQQQQALKNFQQAEKICSTPGFIDKLTPAEKKLVIHTYYNLAELYALSEKKALCRQSAQKAAQLATDSQDKNLQAITLPMMGGLLMENGSPKEAKAFLELGYKTSLDTKLPGNALIAASYLMSIENDTQNHIPEENEWMAKAASLLPLVSSDYPLAIYYSTASHIYLEAGELNLAHEMQGKAMGLQALQDIYSPEQTKKYINDIKKEEANKLTAKPDSARLADLQPADTAKAPESRDVAQKDSVQTRIKYIHVRNQKIGIIGVILAIVVLAFLSYILWQYYRRRRMARAVEQQMTERYIEGLESERNRMARELHDDVSNQLLAVEMKLNSDGPTEQTRQLLSESRERIRRVSHELMPPEFSHHSLEEVLENYIDSINGARNCEITLNASPAEAQWNEIPPKTALEIYRIVQESIGNTLKHSEASLIAVGMKKEGKQVTVTIGSNGKSSDSKTPNGIGLRTIQQRARSIGAKIESYSSPFGHLIQISLSL